MPHIFVTKHFEKHNIKELELKYRNSYSKRVLEYFLYGGSCWFIIRD